MPNQKLVATVRIPVEVLRLSAGWCNAPIQAICFYGTDGSTHLHSLTLGDLLIQPQDELVVTIHPGPELEPQALTDEEIVEELQSILEEGELGVTVEELLKVIREDLQPAEPEYDDGYGQEDPDDEA